MRLPPESTSSPLKTPTAATSPEDDISRSSRYKPQKEPVPPRGEVKEPAAVLATDEAEAARRGREAERRTNGMTVMSLLNRHLGALTPEDGLGRTA
jgi:hypothetical protein